MTMARVYPIPFPRPSKRESKGPLYFAKASARPRTTQLTTIKERKTPKEAYRFGMKAFVNLLTIVTKAAMMTMKAGISISSGISFRRREMITFEQTRTKVKRMPIPNAVSKEVVTASAGQVPRTAMKRGLFLKIPVTKAALWRKLLSLFCFGAFVAVSVTAVSLFAIIVNVPPHHELLRSSCRQGVEHRKKNRQRHSSYPV